MSEAALSRPGDIEAQRGATAESSERQRAAGENYGDSSGKLWSMYLTEAEKQDKEITESWKGDTDGILVFTGLFSATVAAFIIESYKQLSPDSGDTTVVLLTQISQQLVGISNGTRLQDFTPPSNQAFTPPASAIRVNIMWFLSLILSLTCALSATLMQQWARRYLELAQRRGAPHKRARIRAYIFDGIKGFKLSRAVETMPTLLHISVFLFFIGLFDFLLAIDHTVAFFVLGFIVAFAFAYLVLTALPNFFLNCPYRTPLSGFTWKISQIFVLTIVFLVREVEGTFHGPLLSLYRRIHRNIPGRFGGPSKWRDVLDAQVNTRRKWLSDGLRQSVVISAFKAPWGVDADALNWTLTALDEDHEIEDFAARMPGFFESRAVPDASSAILSLMKEPEDQPHSDPILGSRIYELLKTCIPGTSPLPEVARKRRLRVCLQGLWYCTRAYQQPVTKDRLPPYVRIMFASPEMTRRIRAEEDDAARVIGRCFGALLAKKLAQDIIQTMRRRSHGGNAQPIDPAELACLSSLLDTTSSKVAFWLSQTGATDLANVCSLVSDEIESLAGGAVPTEAFDIFRETLDTLTHGIPVSDLNNDLAPELVERFRRTCRVAESRGAPLTWLHAALRPAFDALVPIRAAQLRTRSDVQSSSTSLPNATGPVSSSGHWGRALAASAEGQGEMQSDEAGARSDEGQALSDGTGAAASRGDLGYMSATSLSEPQPVAVGASAVQMPVPDTSQAVPRQAMPFHGRAEAMPPPGPVLISESGGSGGSQQSREKPGRASAVPDSGVYSRVIERDEPGPSSP